MKSLEFTDLRLAALELNTELGLDPPIPTKREAFGYDEDEEEFTEMIELLKEGASLLHREDESDGFGYWCGDDISDFTLDLLESIGATIGGANPYPEGGCIQGSEPDPDIDINEI